MGAGRELARREATETAVAGTTPAQPLARSCWKMQSRWPLKEPGNGRVKATPGLSRYLTAEIESRRVCLISENSVATNPVETMHKVSLR